MKIANLQMPLPLASLLEKRVWMTLRRSTRNSISWLTSTLENDFNLFGWIPHSLRQGSSLSWFCLTQMEKSFFTIFQFADGSMESRMPSTVWEISSKNRREVAFDSLSDYVGACLAQFCSCFSQRYDQAIRKFIGIGCISEILYFKFFSQLNWL